MRKTFRRPSSTPQYSSSIITGASSRKVSSAYFGGNGNGAYSDLDFRESSLIDEAQLEGRIKVFSAIKNPDLCLSVNYRPDGRFYAVALANGLINVYNSKTDNILYTLNNDDKNLPFNDASTTCVRFKPFHFQKSPDESSVLSHCKGGLEQRKKSKEGSEAEHFLPPINSSKSLLVKQYPQGRRKSSVSALGLRSIADELGLAPSGLEKIMPNNLVTATFTDGFVKTFNFVTEQCVSVVDEKREVLTMGYSNSGSVLATGGGDGKIHVYDDDTKRLKVSYDPPFEYKAEYLRTYSIAFHPESDNEFLSGGWNKYIQFYDVRVPNLIVAKIQGPKMTGEGLSFHPSGNEFCAAAWRKGEGIQLFDYSMRERLQNIRACPTSNTESVSDYSGKSLNVQKEQQWLPSLFLYSAQYFMDNFIAVCGAHPGSMAIVQRSSGNVVACLKGLKKSVYGIDSFRSKVLLLVGNEVSGVEIFI